MEKFIKPSSKFDNFKYTVNALISLSSLNLYFQENLMKYKWNYFSTITVLKIFYLIDTSHFMYS